MKILADLFHTSWVRALFGIALCALLIGFGGPYLGLGDTQPLASVTSRFVAIAVVAAIWIGVLMGRRWLAARRSERLGAELSSQPDGERADSDARARAERDALRHRFAEAMAVLRKRRDGGGDLRELPWYLLIGAPGSGKSTLLEHSGLEFPLLGGLGQRSLGGVGGTRDCDWWFTDRAVFLDTAGRYTTQDSDPHADASAWTGFLGLLRRHRRRRPVNGILLTMSVADVLTMTDTERQQHAQRLRERLDEIGTRLGVAVPVYMVFTKCDLVAGFMEFFDALDPAGRAQAWGTTFTAAQSVQGGAPGLLGTEFDALLERIDERVIERMHAERDVRRRARILSFPQQLRAFREAALPLVSSVFGSHAYGRPPLLRGVYLTSGTQEGTPIDRVLSVVGRSFGMHATAPASTRAQRRTYFTERLLKETILPEAGFVGADPVAWRRRRLAEAAAIGGIGVLAVALVVGMTTSFGRNADYVARVDQALHDFPVDDPGARPGSLRQYYAQALQRLDVLARAERMAGQVRDPVPWSMRFGLFQGDAVFDEVRGAHEREFQASVVPGLALQFRDDLRGLAGDPQRLYYVLKGYLMLGDASHRDRDQLVLLAGERWREVFPDEDSLVQALEGHFRILFDGSDKMRDLPLDNSLVEAARATLRAADLATLIYGGVKIDSASRRDAPVRLDRVLGLRGDVFRRHSGAPLSRPLPALFTRPLFAAMVQGTPASAGGAGGGISSAVDRFVADGWVFGATTADPLQRVSLAAQVRALYVADYIRAWDGLLGDLELQPVSSVQEASGVAARLAGPGSPLKALLALVRDNTKHLLGTASAGGTDDGADAPITDHFATLDQLTDGAAGATPLDHTLGTLDQLSKTLLSRDPAADAIGRPDPALSAARLEAAQLPPPLSAWVGSLVGSSQSLVSKGASGALADGFREAAGADCTRFVQGRYPFVATRGNDIPLQDFAALFGNGGRFDTFFRQTLSRVVDSAGPTWTFRDADSAKAGAGVLAGAQLADTIRQVYFRDGPQPQVGFTVSVTTPPAGIDRLTIEVDGQAYEYKTGQAPVSVAMRWPGPKPGLTRISAWDTSGNPLPVLEYPGDWGFFHALDAASLQRRTETRFGATFGFGSTHANVDIEAASLRNPFSDSSVRRFRCPA